MSLEHILLGMLEQPASGYDLGREFEGSARLFWAAELSQIYPTLKRLEARGHLTSSVAPSARGPNRRVYERTPSGTAELANWLREEPELVNGRLPHVAQFYFLGNLEDVETTRSYLERLTERLEARLATYREIEGRICEEHGGIDDISLVGYHRYATLQAGIRVAEARLAWCSDTLEGLARREGEASTLMTTNAGEL